jgi:putative transposase
MCRIPEDAPSHLQRCRSAPSEEMLQHMPNYRRFTVPGALYFFTVVTNERRPFLVDELARKCLREAFDVVRARYPFEIPAIVLLPDHLHAVWSMPEGDSDYSLRWRRIKEEFTERYLAQGGDEGGKSNSRQKRKERAVWHRRFWEHMIRDDNDFEGHVDYIHYNPVKHQLVTCPGDWLYSSFHAWVRRGIYPARWGCGEQGPISFADLNETAME